MKRFLFAMMLAHVCAIVGLAADSTISASAKQRYPWNGVVDLQFTIIGDSGTKYDTPVMAKDSVEGVSIMMDTIFKIGAKI